MRLKTAFALMAALAIAAAVTLPAAAADKESEAREIVENARATLSHFLNDPDMKWIRAHMKDAKGILIVPVQNKGGFIFAGAGGAGVLLAKDAKGDWSAPAFYRLASVSVGLQIGGEHSEVMLFVQSTKGVDSFLASSFKLGGEASVAAGPVGQGAKASTADILSFSRSKGAFVGASLDGTMVNPAGDLNEAFYRKPVSPVDILVRRSVENPAAEGLQGDLEKAGGTKK